MKIPTMNQARRALPSSLSAIRWTVAAALVAVTFASCDTHSPVEPGEVASITLTPNPVTLSINEAQQFTATGFDAEGREISSIGPGTGSSATWEVVNGGGMINSSTGLFTAGTTTGTFGNTVRVSVGDVSATATVNVVAGPAATITVSPNPATLEVNEGQQFTATAEDEGGNPVPITPTWSVVNGGGMIDSGSGLFTAGTTTGTFNNTVRATSGSLSGTATVNVTAGPAASITVSPDPATVEVNDTQQFTATAVDAFGNPVSITPTWAVVNGGGMIDPSTGLFTAGTTTGTFNNTVEATSGSLSDAATVNVTAGPAASITVSPDPATVEINDTQQFMATAVDAFGNPVSITPTWAVVNGGGMIDPGTGLFTAGTTTGTFNNTVEATSGSLSDAATVIVTATPPPPASPLNSAADFGILAGSGISCAISGSVTGASSAADIGSSPTLTIDGFPPCTFDGSIPPPADVATAKGDLTAAYLAAQGETCDVDLTGTDLGSFDSSNPLPPGTYCFSTSVGLTGTLVLAGDATDTWTFQIGSTLVAEVGSQVLITGGGVPDNVFWAVGSSATLNTNSAFQGNIMAQASITLQADVTLLGRALAQDGAVDLTEGGVFIVRP